MFHFKANNCCIHHITVSLQTRSLSHTFKLQCKRVYRISLSGLYLWLRETRKTRVLRKHQYVLVLNLQRCSCVFETAHTVHTNQHAAHTHAHIRFFQGFRTPLLTLGGSLGYARRHGNPTLNFGWVTCQLNTKGWIKFSVYWFVKVWKCDTFRVCMAE